MMTQKNKKDIQKMIATILVLAIVLLITVTVTGCNKTGAVQEENQVLINSKGVYSLIHIGNGLYYDNETGIVYWWGGVLGYSSGATVPSAYYSSNGNLCRYNSETRFIEEILK